MEQPITSRHGSKGGRFIDGMYSLQAGLEKILGISIIQDSGILSDHDLVISSLDLGIEHYLPNKEKEERIDFKSIMNIPVTVKANADHPTLNDRVYKGMDFTRHAKLYSCLQDTCYDPEHQFDNSIGKILTEFRAFESTIIERTKATITTMEQNDGKLLPRTKEDANRLNDLSSQFFTLIHSICREADLSSKVPIVQASSLQSKRNKIKQGKELPGVTSFVLSKSIDQAVKRCRRLHQRSALLSKAVRILLRANNEAQFNHGKQRVMQCMKRFLRQQEPCSNDILSLITIYQEVETDRKNHITSIETARGQHIFDNQCEFSTFLLETHGKSEFELYTHTVKEQIFGTDKVKRFDPETDDKQPKIQRLHLEFNSWWENLEAIDQLYKTGVSQTNLQQWRQVAQRAKQQSQRILKTIQNVKQEEWLNAKTHYLRAGKHGPIARMTNPKARTGPIAGSFYTVKTGDPVRQARNDKEREEACTATHQIWMDNPPGGQNCHFLDLTEDEVGPNGVLINVDKTFDDQAQWKYLEGPFKYDCRTGEYLYKELEASLRKDITKGNGKARATGFAIPVLGRLPKEYTDAYLIKCKIQMALRLLDLGTECSLRICIGKPCGGVRPLTVSHDDNVYLNGFAQQVLQKEIARLQILPENLCSYQRGKGCNNATIVDGVVKEILLQNNTFYMAEIVDDAEKMFDRLFMELQAVLLLLAGAGIQGFTEWQCANMHQRTNRLVTDIFTALIKYICGLPQGNGFSVEIANLYALLLLLWWNMDPLHHHGTIAPFSSPRHSFPLIAGGVIKPIASLAYVDDANRYVAMPSATTSLPHFFEVVQGYCNLLAELSLAIKMGRNVKKCTIFLYNIPEGTIIPVFTSIAWSYDARGPFKGSIATVVMNRDPQGNLILYDVPTELRKDAPECIQNVLNQRKYLGVSKNAQQENQDGKAKLITKLSQRLGLVSRKADSIQEARINHNMLVCQVANYSPICIDMSLPECGEIDNKLLKAYHYKMRCMTNDTKHHIFISQKRGGIGVKSFTREYFGSLIRDVEVEISNPTSLSAHSLCASLEAAIEKKLWLLHQQSRLPTLSQAAEIAERASISGRKTISYCNDMNDPCTNPISHDHSHMMERAVYSLSQLGFMLRNLDYEFIARYTDELLLSDQHAKALAAFNIASRAQLSPIIAGNHHFSKYTMLGHIGLLLTVTTQEAIRALAPREATNDPFERLITNRSFHESLNLFPKEISPIRLSLLARETLRKFRSDYMIASFIDLYEWRQTRNGTTAPSPTINDSEYSIIIDETNCFQPIYTQSMDQNSTKMSEHLVATLRLNHDNSDPWAKNLDALSEQEILDQALLHDLPIFVSIDGSLDDHGVATVSTSIVAPDIRETDVALEWKDRIAKPLLVRSWRLPSTWGNSKVCINMAETIGFLLGDYTVPPNIPVIYITDSNNARTLQRNLTSLEQYTHRKQIRNIKQGIDSSIANHLDHLTQNWLKLEQLSEYHQRLYQRGERVCKIWADANASSKPPTMEACDTENESHDTDSVTTLEDDNASLDPNDCAKTRKKESRFTFNHSMYDLLNGTIVMKVYSHQLNKDFQVSLAGKSPQPNMFVASANQIVDNTAEQIRHLSKNSYKMEWDKISYPPFSPKWSFSFEGSLTIKGATKVFQDKLDLEMLYRHQCRPKQGVFFRMLPFIGLSS
eukprot:CAMPEP_0172416722 /NCGR_PEP_ID=MMETSP1064-20121228/3216_1 /TAXON_ID=202472 /ORGANISM="Aulacoseira subarctica , Strain CCAP 1002/5" /LENGTH=1681 /DNA_ID=CAMNT_0013154579 /DNA_START=343 /DNA_END=5384 /DNA_ORIENTATION=-